MVLTWLLMLLTCECPSGWYVATVRPNGVYACARVPELGVCDSKGGCNDARPDEKLWGLVLCAGSTWNVNGRRVGCR